ASAGLAALVAGVRRATLVARAVAGFRARARPERLVLAAGPRGKGAGAAFGDRRAGPVRELLHHELPAVPSRSALRLRGAGQHGSGLPDFLAATRPRAGGAVSGRSRDGSPIARTGTPSRKLGRSPGARRHRASAWPGRSPLRPGAAADVRAVP